MAAAAAEFASRLLRAHNRHVPRGFQRLSDHHLPAGDGCAFSQQHHSGEPAGSDLAEPLEVLQLRHTAGLREQLHPVQPVAVQPRWLYPRMDFVESPKSQWSGRYSWGSEVQKSGGLSITGTKITTGYEQYLGTNTRIL